MRRLRRDSQCLSRTATHAALGWLAPGALAALALGCQSKPSEPAAEAVPTVVTRADLPEDRAKVVLAKVGERTITLGDYVSALERMDRFERLRYQTKERRKLLLDEMIEVELLAREAERLGLDKEPETRAAMQQLMREEVLRELRDKAPRLEDIPQEDVAAYYDSHPNEFSDPERRRVAVIALADAKTAEQVLAEVRGADAKRWGEMARARSLLKSPAKVTGETARPPLEFEGDLGLTSAGNEERGKNPAVPDPVRDAVFRLSDPGEVYPEVVPAGGRFYVVRLLAKSPARKRSLAEAETVIRARLVQQAIEKAEAALEAELAQKYPVQIDEAALASLELPQPAAPIATGQASATASSGTPSSSAAAPAPRPSGTTP